MQDTLLSLLYTLPGIIIALSFHEWAHAFAAYKMGDPTARNLGRLTLNPIAHIDPIGFLMMVIAGFGWAKPVPVNPNKYRNYKKGELIVSLAGVTMNLILAIISTLALVAFLKFMWPRANMGTTANRILTILQHFILINLALMVFNLLPLYPLDGFHVAQVTLSKYTGAKPFDFLKQYGQFILIGILLLGRYSGVSIISIVVNAIFSWLFDLFVAIFNLFGI